MPDNAEAKKFEAKYHDLWDQVNKLNLEIVEKRKAGKGVTRLARKMKKIEDEARGAEMAMRMARKQNGGRKTTRRRKSSSRKNVPK